MNIHIYTIYIIYTLHNYFYIIYTSLYTIYIISIHFKHCLYNTEDFLNLKYVAREINKIFFKKIKLRK